MIGLGRMGMNMSVRLIRGGHRVVAHDPAGQKRLEARGAGIRPAASLRRLAGELPGPRIIWMMIPAGRPVDDTIDRIRDYLQPGDILVDGGNSYFRDGIRRKEELARKGIAFLDIGVSGGIWGLENGYCLMVGGERRVFKKIQPVLKALAPEGGYMYCGPAGAGHFVKMVHNAIEYGLMEAYAEGFSLLHASPYGKGIDLAEVSELWNRGSVVRSWLLELAGRAFSRDPGLGKIRGYVEDSGEGRWSVQEAAAMGVAAEVTALSLFSRFRSRQEDSFSDKVIAALRKEFGGHPVESAGRRGGKRRRP